MLELLGRGASSVRLTPYFVYRSCVYASHFISPHGRQKSLFNIMLVITTIATWCTCICVQVVASASHLAPSYRVLSGASHLPCFAGAVFFVLTIGGHP